MYSQPWGMDSSNDRSKTNASDQRLQYQLTRHATRCYPEFRPVKFSVISFCKMDRSVMDKLTLHRYAKGAPRQPQVHRQRSCSKVRHQKSDSQAIFSLEPLILLAEVSNLPDLLVP